MNWPDYYKQLTLSLIAIPIAMGGVIYMAKLIFDRWFKAREQDYEHRLKALEIEQQHKLEIQKNTHIESLRLLGQRDVIGFTKLHEIRAEHIADLYEKVLELYWVGTEFLPGNQPKIAKQEEFQKQIGITWTAIEKTKIYFTKAQATKFVAFIQEIRSMGLDRMFANENYKSPHPHEQLAATQDNMKRWDKLQNLIPKMLESIEDDFRLLLRVEEDTHKKG